MFGGAKMVVLFGHAHNAATASPHAVVSTIECNLEHLPTSIGSLARMNNECPVP